MPALTTVITHATGDVYPAADWNTYIRDNLNYLINAGTALATAATITPTNEYQLLTGSVTVTNITAGTKDGQEVLFLVRDGTTIQHNGGGTGNIRLAGATDAAMPARSAIMLLWDATTNVWQEIARVGAGGSATVATTIAALGTGIGGKLGWLRVMPTTFNNGGALALPSAVITVGDTSQFATAGTLTTANGTITYTGKTATTFTGCTGGVGTLSANAPITQATVTTGSAMFDMLAMVYDAVLGKWVSPVREQSMYGAAVASGAFAINTWEEYNSWPGSSGLGGFAWPNWRAYDAAGLKPQARMRGFFAITSSLITNAQLRVHFRAADRAANANVDNGADVNSGGVIVPSIPSAGPMWSVETLWGNIPNGYTLKDWLIVTADYIEQSNAPNNQLWNPTAEVRWIG